MRVSEIYSLLLVFLLVATTKSFANNNAVLRVLDEDVKAKIVLLSDKITKCKQQAQSSSLVLETNVFKKLKVKREDLLKALYYLNIRNKNHCEGGLRESLAYAIGQLAYTRNELGLAVSDYSKASAELLYESTNFLKVRAHYESQSKPFRDELEKQIGTTVFDFNSLLETLNTDEW
ncbi:hypothetical protein CWC05_12595 [Pseudoalteromonas ruthenica]|uniref:Uncharacterized protein n=1 Tax=Pseudoalteromonas ruthenica TaxID=151081 RepID=A0A5S3Z338_9GAMM|nr:hypothetical protein CWC05_12595 [Pseudoalteromonas ruthenica]